MFGFVGLGFFGLFWFFPPFSFLAYKQLYKPFARVKMYLKILPESHQCPRAILRCRHNCTSIGELGSGWLVAGMEDEEGSLCTLRGPFFYLKAGLTHDS